MSIHVFTLAVVFGLIAGLLIYWYFRNWFAAISIPLVIVVFVALVLPWDVPQDETAVPDPSATPMPTLADLEALRPIEVTAAGYVASDACRECHEDQHKSWFASYHRTMTQIASADNVIGDFNDRHLAYGDLQYHLYKDGDVCWADLPGRESAGTGAPTRATAAMVMTTGSHHMQAYWFATGEGRTTGILPWIFLKETQEWIPRSAAFLTPGDEMSYEFGRWSVVCAKCHSTHHRERSQPVGGWDTHVSEFGISCEACHGPGEQHIALHRSLSADGKESASLADLDDPMVNPAALAKEVSSQVCGQCHSVFVLKEEFAKRNQHGHSFRPSRDLHASHAVVERDSPERHLMLDENGDEERQLNQWYYRDGMIRVSGREYNGLIASACYERGEMTCLTCHQMHKSDSDSRQLGEWANDQLQPHALGDGTCLNCHSADQYGAAHTHHQAGSSGSSCYNCHMPHTTYGLLKAIRSHTISSPDVGKDLAASRPNACNLCHLDQTMQWTADKLHEWYDIEQPELDEDQQQVAASLLWLLKGDAAERALTAWSMGWPAAQQTSGTDWYTPFLAQLLDDPYAAVRVITRRSIRSLDGLGNLQVDVMDSRDCRNAILSIAQEWHQNQRAAPIDRRELLYENGRMQMDAVKKLIQQRDNSPVHLVE